MGNEGETRCDHIGIMTSNAETLIQFYAAKLGFEMEKDETLPASIAQEIFGITCDLRFVRMVLGDVKIELFEPIEVEEGRGNMVCGGYHHWGLHTGDREGVFERLRRDGVDVVEVRKNDGHVVYFARDPDGNLIEIR